MKLDAIKPMAPAFLIFVTAAIVFGLYGFDGVLSRDEAYFVYSGQRMAEGVPLYVSIFLNHTPLGPMLAGLGVVLSRALGWDDVYTVRGIFFVISCLTAVGIYFLGAHLFQSPRSGFLSALVFIGFSPFAEVAGSGPQSKTAMVLFAVLSLLLTSQRRWFWAGLFGSLSFLVWQPTAIFPMVTLLLAAAMPREERLLAVLRTIAGIGLPLLLVVVYFQYYGALYEFVEGAILFNVLYLDRGEVSLLSHLLRPVKLVLNRYSLMFVPILIGFIMVIDLYRSRRQFHSSLMDTLTRDAFSPILLSFPAPVVWSLIDFQGNPDLFVFLPYLALGFALFLDLALQGVLNRTSSFLSMALVAGFIIIAVINGLRSQDYGLAEQREAALGILEKYGEDVRLVTIGSPEVLVLLHRVNPTRYLFVKAGVDRLIQVREPGGFAGWIQELEAYEPEVIVFGRTLGDHIPQLRDWLKANYHEEQAGQWRLQVKNE